MNDAVLDHCNETELLGLARGQGLGILRRGLDRRILISLVRGEMNPSPEHLSEIQKTRHSLELFIQQNWGKVSSQLPGCTGTCTTYPCSESRHAKCYKPGKG